MKKLIELAISLILCFTFVGCGEENNITSSVNASVSVSTQTPSIPEEPIHLSKLSFGDVTEEEFGRMCLAVFQEMYLELYELNLENPPYGDFSGITGNRSDITDLTFNPTGNYYEAYISYRPPVEYLTEEEIEERDVADYSLQEETALLEGTVSSSSFVSKYYEYGSEPLGEIGIPYSKYPPITIRFMLLENTDDIIEIKKLYDEPTYSTSFITENIYVIIESDRDEGLNLVQQFMESTI